MERRGEGAKCPPGELQEDGCRRSLAEGQEDESGGTRADETVNARYFGDLYSANSFNI
jgi:hypothetical protein